MIVYFVASRRNINARIEDLRRFVKIIHQKEHTLALDWVEPIFAGEQKKKMSPEEDAQVDWPILYKQTVESITRADVFIAETSVQSFGVGFQVALAIQMKKPVLLLHRDDVKYSVFASGIPEANAAQAAYNEKNLQKIIEDFLDENDIQAKDMRFNFFIDRQIYNYLRWSSHKSGKTKAEILRELVVKEIDKESKVG